MNFSQMGELLGSEYGNSIFRLGLPWALLLLILLPFLLWWLRYRERRKRVSIALPVTHLAVSVARGNPRRWRLMLDGMRVFAMGLMIVAMARPQYGRIERETFSEGIDIAMVLDVSLSMRAGDFHPNRLEAAKDVMK